MKASALLFVASVLSSSALMGVEQSVPPALLQGLASDVFPVREKSQSDLLGWARESPQTRAKTLYSLSVDEDPEVRKRSAEILRELSDDDYLSDGQGYIGIRMTEEGLDGDPEGDAQRGIRINMVMRNSPADNAGLKVGDLVVALDGKVWKEVGAINVFMEIVAGKKPQTDAVLSVRRDAAEPIDIKVKLGKRPVADLQTARNSIEMLDKQAKDEHFRKRFKLQQP